MATMLKNLKLLYLRNRLSYRDEILHGDAQYHSAPTKKIWILKNPKWRTAAILKKK